METYSVRVLFWKAECDKFMRCLPYKSPVEKSFDSKEGLMAYLQNLQFGYRQKGFGLFTKKKLPISPNWFEGLQFVQYEI